MTVERIEPPLTGSERETLRAYLDWHRATLALKCEQLSDTPDALIDARYNLERWRAMEAQRPR